GGLRRFVAVGTGNRQPDAVQIHVRVPARGEEIRALQNLRRTRWLAWPSLLYLTIFFLVPLGIVVSYSVLRKDYAGGVLPEFSAEAWAEFFKERTLAMLGWSLGLALGVTAVCLLVAYPCVLALGRLDRRWRQVLVLAVAFPLITSQLLRVYGW